MSFLKIYSVPLRSLVFVNFPNISQNSFLLVNIMNAPRSHGRLDISNVAKLKLGMSVCSIEHSLMLDEQLIEVERLNGIQPIK